MRRHAFQETTGDSTTERWRRRAVAGALPTAALVAVGLAGLGAAPAAAAVITVTTTADTPTAGQCTLREAITAANTDTATGGCAAGSGSDTIIVQAGVSGTIQLTSTLPDITTTMAIEGPGADVLVVRGDRDLGGTPLVRGLLVTETGVLDLSGLRIERIVGDLGGAIGNRGTLTLSDVWLTGNVAAGFTVSNSLGGGVANAGTLTVLGSAITGNEASNGGGVFNSGTATVVNTTLSGNDGLLGGGVYTTGTTALTHVTLVGNVGFQNGGGIFDDPSGSTLLRGSIVAGNTLELGAAGDADCNSNVVDNGYNLSDDGGCGFSTGNGSIPSSEPLLAALAVEDGTTATMVPQALSPAIDAVPLTAGGQCVTGATSDQRGVVRPQGTGCDIGAVEVAPEAPTDTFAPHITVASPAEGAAYLAGVTLLADYTCTDEEGGSGVASCVGTVPVGAQVDTATVGPKVFTVSSSDNADNAGFVDVDYSVVTGPDVILGFGAPVSVEAPNTAKAGRAVPLKFTVTDAAGTPVVLDGDQVSIVVHPCGTPAASLAVAEAVTGHSGLQSFAGGAYQVNVATQRSWARSCHTLGVDLGGGVRLTADFEFSR